MAKPLAGHTNSYHTYSHEEALQGIAAATLQKTFSGGLFAIGVTDRRLVGWLGGAPGGSLTRTRGGGGV